MASAILIDIVILTRKRTTMVEGFNYTFIKTFHA